MYWGTDLSDFPLLWGPGDGGGSDVQPLRVRVGQPQVLHELWQVSFGNVLGLF
jgi:hypothetical protein